MLATSCNNFLASKTYLKFAGCNLCTGVLYFDGFCTGLLLDRMTASHSSGRSTAALLVLLRTSGRVIKSSSELSAFGGLAALLDLLLGAFLTGFTGECALLVLLLTGSIACLTGGSSAS